ncbi:hypothetical protein [Komagataeibacter nataicola]|uniref:hypothetical protein n=2 Tax=Komagataeibacter nataicola TaxID=265960 RepID=UPI002156843F|nr:hypothetical protein [Komagataeibacter nataicola]GBR25522.1 hypothetical protein AA0616_2996 [Komagataeibacter nataicola NRIC 0616]
MARYLICLSAASGDKPANYVVNTIEWDGKAAFTLPASTVLIEDADSIYQPGDTYGVTPARSVPVNPAATVPLATQAQNALTAAASATWQAYGMYGQTTPTDVVTYLNALKAIAAGTDTTSTALPVAPADLSGATTTT